MGTKSLLQCSQDHATGTYPKPDKSTNSHYYITVLSNNNQFNT